MNETHKKYLKIGIVILIAIFYSSLLIYKINLPVADDMARHLVNGREILQGHFAVLWTNFYSYVESAYPFVNHHWLAGPIYYILYIVSGWSGLVVFKVLLLLVTFFLLFWAALRRSDFWLVALFSIPAILIMGERTALRPENFSYFFIALFLALLLYFEEHPESKKVFWLIPMQLLWVNLHIFFVIGPAMVAGFLLEKIIENRKNIRNSLIVKRTSWLLLGLILICFINPNGLHGFLEPITIFNNYGIAVTENQSVTQFFRTSPPFDSIAVLIFEPAVALLAISFYFGFKRKKKPIFLFLGCLATAIMGFFIIRTVIFFGMFFLPAITYNLSDLFAKARERLKKLPEKIEKILTKIGITLITLIILFLVITGFTGTLTPYTTFGLGLAPRSLEPLNFLKANNISGPIFDDYDIGSYLIFGLYPEQKVFVDNRPEAYPTTFWQNAYLSMLKDETVWQSELGAFKFNAIVFYQYDQGDNVRHFIYNRIHDPDWALVYSDQFAVILVRNIPANEEIIKKFGITPDNAPEKLKYLTDSANFDEQVAAADTFNLLGRSDLAADTFLRIALKWPDKGKIWMTMGEWELSRDDVIAPRLAMMYLQKAISLNYGTAEAYSFLGAAYIKLNETASAEDALRHALQINPDRTDAKTLFSELEQFKVQ